MTILIARPVGMTVVLSLVVISGLCLLLGCTTGSKPKTIFEDPKFAGWIFFEGKNVRIFHAPGHPLDTSFSQIAGNYEKSTKRVCDLLGIEIPADTLTVIYYTGYGQGREMTGREYPFVENGIIHFWLPSYLGPTLVQYLMGHFSTVMPKHIFLQHGMIALFDFSGQNYHASTSGYVKSKDFIPLEKLAVDTSINSDTERLQSAEAASFVAYILANYGASRLKTMFESQASFPQMVQELFYEPIDSLQSNWLNFALENTPPDTTTEKSASEHE